MSRVQLFLMFKDNSFFSVSPGELDDTHQIVAAQAIVDGKEIMAMPSFDLKSSIRIGGRLFSSNSNHLSAFRYNIFYVTNRDKITYPQSLVGKHAIDVEKA
jgi:hypothetical protein